MAIRIYPPEEMVDTVVALPLSKSISARVLVLDAVARVPTTVAVADCDDTAVLRDGVGRREGTVDVRLAGTALRFLTAYYAAVEGTDVVLTGGERLCERPISGLVDALRELGADIEYVSGEGHAPLHIRGRRLRGGRISVPAEISSQYISSLMMVAPLMEAPLCLDLQGVPVSVSYIRMTAEMLRRRGVDAEIDPRENTVTVANTPCGADGTCVERDWSAASYWYEIAALSAGWVTLPGLVRASLQGDSAMAELGARLGVVTGEYDPEDDDEPKVEPGTEAIQLSASPEVFSRLDADLGDTPDIAQTLAVTAAMLGVPFHLTGLATLRDKETDRIEALVRELDKIGFVAEADGRDAIVWDGTRRPIGELPVFDTYNDHRMAMAFAPVSMYIPGIVINDPEVVSKSYPTYWEDLANAGFRIVDAAEPIAEEE